LLGFDAETATPIEGTWKDLYSSAIAGVSGSGKTTTVRFLAAQSALHAARWVLLDPHADAGDDSLAGTLQPLASTFLCAPAIQPRAMLESVKLVADELDRRLANRSADAIRL
jgi:ABC-type glutathione transport system ATPase component